MPEDVEKIVAGLSDQVRSVAVSLCGNAWTGLGKPTPGIMLLNSFGLMHIDALKAADGRFVRFKAKPTSDGLAVRAHLLSTPNAEKSDVG